MKREPLRDTPPVLGETVSYDAIEKNSKVRLRRGLGYTAAGLALSGALYVSAPSEVQHDIQDALGFATQGITDKIQQGNDFSDQPAPVTHSNPFGHAERANYHVEANAAPTPAGAATETYVVQGNVPVGVVHG